MGFIIASALVHELIEAQDERCLLHLQKRLAGEVADQHLTGGTQSFRPGGFANTLDSSFSGKMS